MCYAVGSHLHERIIFSDPLILSKVNLGQMCVMRAVSYVIHSIGYADLFEAKSKGSLMTAFALAGLTLGVFNSWAIQYAAKRGWGMESFKVMSSCGDLVGDTILLITIIFHKSLEINDVGLGILSTLLLGDVVLAGYDLLKLRRLTLESGSQTHTQSQNLHTINPEGDRGGSSLGSAPTSVETTAAAAV